MKTKELTIEEKAKAYDRAIANAKELLEVGLKDTRDKRVVLSFFPELAESEDEKIRKNIINCIKQYISYVEDDECTAPDIKDFLINSAEKYISWLEKQGEQKPAEWSKEDERNFDIIYGIIYNSCNAEDASRLNTWLLSLKPQKQWKPSKEQIMALRWVLNNVPYNGYKEEISGLLEQIKYL